MRILIFLIILLLALGGLGNSFQPSRLLIIFGIIVYINKIKIINPDSKVYSMGLIFYLIWIAYGLISLLWSPNPANGFLSEIIVMIIGMLALPIMMIAEVPNKARLIRNAWVSGFALTTPFAIFELLTGQHFAGSFQDRILNGIGYDAPFAAVFFGNYNYYCEFICMCFPMILWWLVETKELKMKIVLFALALLSILIVLIDTSRTGIFVLLVQVFSFIWIFRKKIKSMIIYLSALSAIGLFFMNDIINGKLFTLIRVLIDYRFDNAFTSADESSYIRYDLIRGGIDLLLNSYCMGIGAGGFEAAIVKTKYFHGLENPHNILLEIGVQYGLIIFLLFVFWMVKIFNTARRNKFLSIPAKNVICISILTIPFMGTMNSKSIGYTSWWIFFASLAVIASVQPLKNKLIINNKLNKNSNPIAG